MEIIINNKKYKVERNYRDALNIDDVTECLTEYFDNFDFILGDYSCGKLRLKGFNNKDNPNFKKINDIETLDYYIENHCAYGCRYFVISRITT